MVRPGDGGQSRPGPELGVRPGPSPLDGRRNDPPRPPPPKTPLRPCPQAGRGPGLARPHFRVPGTVQKPPRPPLRRPPDALPCPVLQPPSPVAGTPGLPVPRSIPENQAAGFHRPACCPGGRNTRTFGRAVRDLGPGHSSGQRPGFNLDPGRPDAPDSVQGGGRPSGQAPLLPPPALAASNARGPRLRGLADAARPLRRGIGEAGPLSVPPRRRFPAARNLKKIGRAIII